MYEALSTYERIAQSIKSVSKQLPGREVEHDVRIGFNIPHSSVNSRCTRFCRIGSCICRYCENPVFYLSDTFPDLIYQTPETFCSVAHLRFGPLSVSVSARRTLERVSVASALRL